MVFREDALAGQHIVISGGCGAGGGCGSKGGGCGSGGGCESGGGGCGSGGG